MTDSGTDSDGRHDPVRDTTGVRLTRTLVRVDDGPGGPTVFVRAHTNDDPVGPYAIAWVRVDDGPVGSHAIVWIRLDDHCVGPHVFVRVLTGRTRAQLST